jgi:hypothetical protein
MNKNSITWKKVNHDVNGNPRYVCSWLEFGTNTYAEAVKLANTIGGKKYNNKQFAGGIVFQSYNINHEEKLIKAFYEYNKVPTE